MNEIFHRIIALILFVCVPAGILLPFIDSSNNETVTGLIGIVFIAWYIYLNMWSKLAARLYNSDSLFLGEAWAQARKLLNNDIIIKLAHLPVIGRFFDQWINRNNPEHGDDREIKMNSEDK